MAALAANTNVNAEPPKKPEKVKLTKKEKEKAERALRRAMPPLLQVGRNGVFEFSGTLQYTFAAGNVPGGPFASVNAVCRGHNLYIFDGGELGHRPTSKPKAFFQIKRCEVLNIGLLVIPPLPPHNHVFKLTFAKKQFGAKSFFFKCSGGKDLQRWLGDLQWRVNASEKEIQRKFEPDRTREIVRHRIDETETAISKLPERVFGMAVRYEARKLEDDLTDEFA
eukprot:CAMPEP_0115861914 /NCGR_PEP_ID=MMETSP0287-20121206/17904_1 /TAXON_ID=412157 /ORGANISM="Chrysochromulina rotalis, Strain UIO044" /LENGTH=222 /DNA_ID=CAMNT_0003316315 /DNA_START=47 /DNA_END=715 /DNA_ORIENTATION=-